jgi:hypothetical protein
MKGISNWYKLSAITVEVFICFVLVLNNMQLLNPSLQWPDSISYYNMVVGDCEGQVDLGLNLQEIYIKSV